MAFNYVNTSFVWLSIQSTVGLLVLLLTLYFAVNRFVLRRGMEWQIQSQCYENAGPPFATQAQH